MSVVVGVPARLGDVLDGLIETERSVARHLSDDDRARRFECRAAALQALRDEMCSSARSRRMVRVDLAAHGWAVWYGLTSLIADEEQAIQRLAAKRNAARRGDSEVRLRELCGLQEMISGAERAREVSLRPPSPYSV